LTSAFTLVEVLVTVSIIATLMAVLVPSLGHAREQARRTVCLAHLKHLGLGLLAYASDHGGYGPPAGPIVGKVSPRELVARSDDPVNLGGLYPKYVNDAGLFRCPSARLHNFDPDTDRIPDGLIAGSYAYAGHVAAFESPKITARRQLAMVVDNFVAHQGGVGLGRYAHRRFYNVLYQDGSGAAYKDLDESIANRMIAYDNETDRYNYASLYDSNGAYRYRRPRKGDYGPNVDFVLAWKAFCFNEPDPFGEGSPTAEDR